MEAPPTENNILFFNALQKEIRDLQKKVQEILDVQKRTLQEIMEVKEMGGESSEEDEAYYS